MTVDRPILPTLQTHADAVVIGTGFGGLGAALTLAEAGLDVLVCETLNYPGGCASTFEKHGARFDAGATLLTGMHEHQWMRRSLARAGVSIPDDAIEMLAHPVELRSPGLTLPITNDRQSLLDALCALPDAPTDALQRFFAFQARVADALWHVLDTPEALPPVTQRMLAIHLEHAPVWLEVSRFAGHPLTAVVQHFGLTRFQPLRTWLDAMCQITVQVAADQAEAPVALGAIDFFFRGCAVMRGGMSDLARAFVSAIEAHGSTVRYTNRVKRIERLPGHHWRVHTRHGPVDTPVVIGNLLPDDLDAMAGRPTSRAGRRARSGWGAAMMYLRTRAPSLGPESAHLELVADPGSPLPGGNHVLVSATAPGAPRAPAGERAVSCSTHIPTDATPDQVEAVQQRIVDTVRRLAPEVFEGEQVRFSASPRTFARFTRRSGGRVGGIPRTAGLLPYLELLPTPLDRGLWAVGDATGLGQSTLATALSGSRTATAILG
jgi:phytoene dehydrogenase-like protein